MKCYSKARIPTDFGTFIMMCFAQNEHDRMPHVVLMKEGTKLEEPIPVRIHSECLTGDLFGSHRCDCGEQLEASLEYIDDNGGLLIYLRQEGRGIGLINKLKAYELQDKGLDTAEANIHLGFEIDEREYKDALTILQQLGVKQIKLLTNNPEKIAAFENSNIVITERIPLVMKEKSENRRYFETKRKLLGHLF
ncbi:MAG TPA: GTP cyclohydrolase II [Saprospiraceae bacterium]|nr:GTP cyclohydrolase II [Saprospiraceae bacterium]